MWKNAAGPVDQFGVYQDTDDGTYYLADGTPLYWYDPTNGNYEEEGDSTIYDAQGNSIGNADDSSAADAGQTTSPGNSTSTLGSIWNFAKGLVTSNQGTPVTAVQSSGQPLVQTTNTSGLILSVLGVIAAGGLIVYLVKTNGKKSSE